jgi:hypothetical protein
VHGQRARDAPGVGSVRVCAQGAKPCFHFGVQLFDRSKLKIFEPNLKISKFKSCRTRILLQLSQGATYVILRGLAGKSTQTSGFSRLGQQGVVNFDWVFGPFALQISNASNWMKCVPGDNEQLLHWSILKYL